MAKPEDITLHMIGHGHIDPTWMWRWTEGYEEVRATFRSALDRMRETPEFKFSASSACFYVWFKEAEPALYEELKQRVAEGRWEIVGGWWLEPDCNTPCGESFVRQGLYGLRFFQQEFGVRVKVGFNPDSFGHAGTFPQILAKLGQEYYAFMRPMAGVEKDYPGGDTFWWETKDGSRVLTANIHESYNTIPDDGCPIEEGFELEQIEEELTLRLKRAPHFSDANPHQRDVLFFFGVGNHGGGPTKTSIRVIEEQQASAESPVLEFSRLDTYFRCFLERTPGEHVPILADELQHHAPGCYSLHHAVKTLNRQVEHSLMTAERLSAVAHLFNLVPYPKQDLESAWKDLLYNQFHDILAGTSLPSSYPDTRDQVGAARHRANSIINRVVQTIARDLDTTAPGNTVVVFNPLPWPVRVPIEVSEGVERTALSPAYIENTRVTFSDDAGVHIPSQVITGERVGGRRYTFIADLPALGYRCFRATPHHLREFARLPKGRKDNTLDVTKNCLENDWWRMEFDPHSGGIARLYDKRTGVEVLKRGAVLSGLADSSDTWGHGITEWRAERGQFANASLSIAESGDVLARVRAHSTYGASNAITEYTLYRDIQAIDITLRVNWQESYTLLKWVFETNIGELIHAAECPYGYTERESSGEEPCQQWTCLEGPLDASGATYYALNIINDGIFGYDAVDGQLRLTLLRSPAFSHHDPCIYESSSGHEIMDQGWHTFRIRLFPHVGPFRSEETARRANEFNAAPFSHLESAHAGERPLQASFVEIDAEYVVLSVIKFSEDGDDLILRAYESAGYPAEGFLRFPSLDKSFPLTFSAHEIKTVRIDTQTWTLRECNLLEE